MPVRNIQKIRSTFRRDYFLNVSKELNLILMIFFTNTTNRISAKLKHYIMLIWCLIGTVAASGQLTEIEFSVERGFYDNPMAVELVADDPSAIIRYTTDNTKPTISYGTIYSGPINVAGTTSIRAIAYTGAGAIPVVTHTYIFLDDIITASYMENNITNSATYGPQMRDALLAIPTISLVSSDVNSNNSIDTEVETSVEMFSHAPWNGQSGSSESQLSV